MVEAVDYKRSQKLVAVVDDDEDVCASLCGLIESMNLRSAHFESADAFLASEEQHSADIVISDVQMPGTSGLELARILQSRGTPTVLITAFPSPEVERQAGEAGVLGFLRKPFDPSALIDLISQNSD